MKKVLSAILVLVMSLSLVACGQANNNKATNAGEATKQENTNTSNTENKEEAKEEAQAQTFETFEDLLNSVGEKDYFYNDAGTIKILDKEALKVYQGKADAITKKAMADNKIDEKSAKVFNYYSNVNGEKFAKDYVVVYDANKAPTTVYEVIMTISDKDEPALKEVKENKELINDQFKTLFPKALEEKTEK